MQGLQTSIQELLPYRISGRVSRVVGLTAAVSDFPAPLGATVLIDMENRSPVEGEVIGFREQETLVMPYGEFTGIRRGCEVTLLKSTSQVKVGPGLLGRVVNSRGEFLDERPKAVLFDRIPLHRTPTSPLHRPRIETPLSTGVRVIDGLLTCGQGQRLGIFAGSGVGKSTLLAQMARSSSADVNVVVLVGERGREVREFLERDLGAEGLAKSVVVVATSDEPAPIRIRSAWMGSAIAEYFRDQGLNVLLMMDSVTRFAHAQREIGLASGEPPATKGYPPSVFSTLPRLLERSGRSGQGSITAFYTVLVEGDDVNEPIADTVRGILDGHVVLTRELAERAHYPAIDVLGSISRSMKDVVTPEQQQAADSLKRLLAAYQQSEDLINIGAYQSGTNREVDLAIQLREPILQFLQQATDESPAFSDVVVGVTRLAQAIDSLNRPVEATADSS